MPSPTSLAWRACALCCCLLGSSASLFGQLSLPFAADLIPAELRVGAMVVVRDHALDLEISSASALETRHRQVITILDKSAEEVARILLPYDQFNTLRDLRCQVYNAAGALEKSYDKKGFQDLSYLDALTLADDLRYLLLDLRGHSLPFTFELEYTYRAKSAFFCPDYYPQPNFYTAVERSRCTVQVPEGNSLLYKPERSPEPVIAKGKNGTQHYTWTFQHLKAIADEPLNLSILHQAPFVRLHAQDFEISGFSGSFRSWDGFARWTHQMLSSLPPLAADVVSDIRRRTQGQSELDKIRTVYRYVQNNTRYISVQLGIGGWKPFDPNFVHLKKYGDCKALSWYTCSLLRAVGIEAYYTLVYAGNDPVELDPAFASQSFNHVILTVPTYTRDTIFLECTSQTCPFGYLGTFTGGRRALMIDQEHGHFVQLPAPAEADNVRTDSVQIQVPAGKEASRIQWYAGFKGLAIEDEGFERAARETDQQDQRKWVERYFNLKGGQIQTFTLQLDSMLTGLPVGQASMEASSALWCTRTAQRLYFQPNFFQPWSTLYPADSARVSPVFRRFGHTYVAKLTVTVPAGWLPESLPADVESQTVFGRYQRSVSFQNGVLQYSRHLVLRAGTVAPEHYPDLVVFYKKMKKWDSEQAVFKQL
ncbi:MAG: DUF3857 domain-containing protein [Saprospiraceae bacterium]|nr:DUF3857 domain-containing protein [Saprospiraceae bacterium]